MTIITTTNTTRSTGRRHPTRPGPLPARTSGAWAWSGVVGALAAIAGMATSAVLAVDTADLVDNERAAAALDGAAWGVWAHQVLTGITAIAVLVFAAGLRRRLVEQEPVGSLVPQLASAGLTTVAVMSLVGGGISTEMFHGLLHLDEVDADTVSAQLLLFNTMSWVWAGIGLTAAAVGYGALRNGSAGRALGWFSVVCAALITLTQVVPLQYLAMMPGALWLLVSGIGFGRSVRVNSRPE